MYKLVSLMPPKLKSLVKSVLNSNGHSSTLINSIKAKHQATTSRSLENCISELTAVFRAADITSIENLACLDFGAGYVLSDSAVMILLGAKRVYAIDYNKIFSPPALQLSIKSADVDRIFESAQNFVDEGTLNERWHRLIAYSENKLNIKDIGIEYIAPFDYSKHNELHNIDLIHSTSVFEHIEHSMIPKILENLTSSLSESGVILTKIHLEDHLDFEKNPFEFFTIETNYDSSRDFDNRGNRLLLSEWNDIFSNIDSLKTILIFSQQRQIEKKLNLQDKFLNLDDAELFVSNAWYLSRKSLKPKDD